MGSVDWKGIGRWLRGLPPEALAVGAGLFAMLAAFVTADPGPNYSWSSGAYGDEWYNIIDARNLVVVGRWATDGWDHHLVNLPYSVATAIVYAIFGTGIAQARLLTIGCVAVAAVGLIWTLRGVVGRVPAFVAGLAFATSGLILYYGRLAFLEDLVVLGLAMGVLTLARRERLSIRWGVVAGLWLGIAIGSKPNSAFSAVGILAALAAVWGWRDPAMRRWLIGVCATIAVAGLIWGVVFFLPNRDAVITDIQIWSPGKFNLSPIEIGRSFFAYFRPINSANDSLYGVQLGGLCLLGLLSTILIAIRRRTLSAAEARLAVASYGWLIFGFGILVITTYKPNRYAIPLAAPLAIVTGIGLRLALAWLAERRAAGTTADAAAGAAGAAPNGSTARDGATIGERAAGGRAARHGASAILVAAVVAIAALPGLGWYATWAPNATYTLQQINDEFARVAPEGTRIAGNHAAQFLQGTRDSLIVTGIANNGDWYSTGVRLYLNMDTDGPPPGVPASAWAARHAIACVYWRGPSKECLYRVP